ncbi:hypothetical protein, partial [Mammaliicoccus sciuri]|uniref:hypothetical protein n=1 Tax=Mammaliicoccus sciuri TaxID=1296 RepID=UPI00115F3232
MSKISNTEKRSYLITLIAMIIHALLVVVNLVVFFRKVPLSTAFDIKSGVLYYMLCFIIQALLLIAFFIFVLSFI